MTFSEETLIAYADGELDAATRAALEAALAQDPQLAVRVERQRALRARVAAAFAPVLDEPVPERLLASARGTAARAAPGTARRALAPARWSWPQWGAMAASLIVGALLGPWLLRAPADERVIEARGGQMLAGGILARALSQQLASTQPRGAPVRIGISFRARSGDYCRTFTLHESGELAGLACQTQGSWRVEALARAEPEPPGGDLRPAGSSLPPAVAAALSGMLAGEPLDAAAESAARGRDWRP